MRQSKRTNPTTNELRALYLLVGECRELGADTFLWHEHLLEGLEGLLGAHVGVGSEGVIELPQLGVEPTLVVDRGWETESERSKWLEFMARYGPEAAPTAVATYRARPYFTGVRRELVDDRAYFESAYYEYRSSVGLEDEIVSLYLGPDGNYQILSLHRYRSEGTWRERDARIVDLLHREIVPMLGNGLTTANDWMAGPLSPRLRQTMELLLDGLSEKQIAGRLQLSEYTVHEYVQKLYRRYGVHSRAALLSAWVPGRRLMQTTRGEGAR